MAAPVSGMGPPQSLPPLHRSSREAPPDYSKCLFGPYQQYYSGESRLPIECLQGIKRGAMVIQPSRVAANRYLAIFLSSEDIPYIKSLDVDRYGFVCDKIRFASFGALLQRYGADVAVNQWMYTYPVVMQAPATLQKVIEAARGPIFGTFATPAMAQPQVPFEMILSSGNFPLLGIAPPPNPAFLMPPPPPPSQKRELPNQVMGEVLTQEVQAQTVPAPLSSQYQQKGPFPRGEKKVAARPRATEEDSATPPHAIAKQPSSKGRLRAPVRGHLTYGLQSQHVVSRKKRPNS